jgi:predicted small metal-binding protein
MVTEEYKQLSCSDVGMACGFQVRAKTEAEVMKLAKTHAAEAHGLKEISADTEKKIKGAIKTVSVDVPEKNK